MPNLVGLFKYGKYKVGMIKVSPKVNIGKLEQHYRTEYGKLDILVLSDEEAEQQFELINRSEPKHAENLIKKLWR